MVWNWRQEGWPEFTWDQRTLMRAEALFIENAGVLIGASKHLDADDQYALRIELMSHEAVDTSAIEGEPLDRDSVQSSIRRRLGLASDRRRVSPAEAGIAEMMVDLYERATTPLTEEALFRWHRWITNGRTDLVDIGRYRTHTDPMQIVSGSLHAPKVHFEAPPSSALTAEMQRFWDWLERTAPGGDTPLPAITRAGIAHLWFESIHPPTTSIWPSGAIRRGSRRGRGGIRPSSLRSPASSPRTSPSTACARSGGRCGERA